MVRFIALIIILFVTSLTAFGQYGTSNNDSKDKSEIRPGQTMTYPASKSLSWATQANASAFKNPQRLTASYIYRTKPISIAEATDDSAIYIGIISPTLDTINGTVIVEYYLGGVRVYKDSVAWAALAGSATAPAAGQPNVWLRRLHSAWRLDSSASTKNAKILRMYDAVRISFAASSSAQSLSAGGVGANVGDELYFVIQDRRRPSKEVR